MDDILRAFILLFAVIDPIGTVPVFLTATQSFDSGVRRRVALRAVIIAAFILLFFIVVGQPLIEHMEISLPAFKVGGGLVLLLFALNMVFGSEAHGGGDAGQDHSHVAVFPLAIPAIASPGAILAVVLLTDNNVYTVGQQAITAVIMLVVLLIVLGFLLSAGFIQKKMGKTGITVISKVMGILLCALAAESMLAGIKEYFGK